jgi:hypothetical protein
MEDGYGRGASSVQCRYVESKIDQHAVAYYIFIFIYYRYIIFIYIYYIYISGSNNMHVVWKERQADVVSFEAEELIWE